MTTQTISRNGASEAKATPTQQRTAARWLCEISGEPVTPEACFACARQGNQPACDFTPAILRALHHSMQPDAALAAVFALASQSDCLVLRVSSLVGCTRQAWYRIRQRPPLEKPARHWARLRGSIFHHALQTMAGKDVIAERRFVVSLQDYGAQVWLAGQVDHYDPQTGVIVDYKTINSNGRRLMKMDLPKEHHVAQLWIYAWLLQKSGWPYPQGGQIVYLDMGKVRRTTVPMPDASTRALIEKRLVEKARAIAEADEGGPQGDPREAWQCRYCLFKQGCPDRDSVNSENSAAS